MFSYHWYPRCSWTESLAVGSEAFIHGVEGNLKNKKKTTYRQSDSATFCLHEPKGAYYLGE